MTLRTAPLIFASTVSDPPVRRFQRARGRGLLAGQCPGRLARCFTWKTETAV